MGGGVAGWLTPGWSIKETRYEATVAKPAYIASMLAEEQDPKPELIKECRETESCKYWKDKLTRCEGALEKIIKINPTKTCIYPMRDYVTCVEACAQPLIHNSLVGTK